MPTPVNDSPQLTLIHGKQYTEHRLIEQLSHAGWHCTSVESPLQIPQQRAAVILLDEELLKQADLDTWRQHSGSVLAAEEQVSEDADLILPRGLPKTIAIKALTMAARQWWYQQRSESLNNELDAKHNNLANMAAIGISLSAEKHLPLLLGNILTEAQSLACCDAASLYLVDRTKPEAPEVVFKLTQNDSLTFPFKEVRLPLNEKSLAGYVVLHNQALNIPDVYEISEDAPYSFNREMDYQTGYRCVSLLALPIKNHRDEVIGVLQFINRKRHRETKLINADISLRETVAFDEDITLLLRALASQSGIALENSVLLEDINQLFEGFVQASVVAIEQRDPSTSGHSFRVADLCIELAQALPKSSCSHFKDTTFSDNALREIRYAALLHDFGKVGVREKVLTKAKKLEDVELQLIIQRIRLAQERLRREAIEQQLKVVNDAATVAMIQQKAATEIQRLELYLRTVIESNEPSILAEESSAILQEIKAYPYLDIDRDDLTGLLSDNELFALSIEKGSLTNEERLEIQSHVVHTERFLKMIPWTPELANVPNVAAAHHEKLDGTGYPHNLAAEKIPAGSKIMTICDIYDALTAADRPYKQAVPTNIAFKILEKEAQLGQLDGDMVRVFIDSGSYEIAHTKQYPVASSCDASPHHHHVCDFNLHSSWS